ncbi:30S ribosomal protein S20 [bacterium]|nr:30S ribosomal protein S20 [bacterium]
MAKLKTGRHTSVIKALRQSKKNHLRNVSAKSKIKTLIKKLEKNITDKKLPEAKIALKEIFSNLDKAAGKNIIHKNTASRKKARLSKKISLKEKTN